jgi:hypothetical protein
MMVFAAPRGHGMDTTAGFGHLWTNAKLATFDPAVPHP